MYDYEDLTWYDYYLVRGFAVVECGGLGTKGSEGFETCGSDLEIDAFKCVIEWLNGERVAYTDKTSNIAIEADWSNGKVGMTGRSYAWHHPVRPGHHWGGGAGDHRPRGGDCQLV